MDTPAERREAAQRLHEWLNLILATWTVENPGKTPREANLAEVMTWSSRRMQQFHKAAIAKASA